MSAQSSAPERLLSFLDSQVFLKKVDSHEVMFSYLLNKAVGLASLKDNLRVYVSEAV